MWKWLWCLCFWGVRLLPKYSRSKYSNCTVNPSKYDKENQGIHFYHYRQAHLIYYFVRAQTPILTHVIQCRIRVRPGYFINLVRLAWPGQNVIWITRMTRSGFNPTIDSILSMTLPRTTFAAKIGPAGPILAVKTGLPLPILLPVYNVSLQQFSYS